MIYLKGFNEEIMGKILCGEPAAALISILLGRQDFSFINGSKFTRKVSNS